MHHKPGTLGKIAFISHLLTSCHNDTSVLQDNLFQDLNSCVCDGLQCIACPLASKNGVSWASLAMLPEASTETITHSNQDVQQWFPRVGHKPLREPQSSAEWGTGSFRGSMPARGK